MAPDAGPFVKSAPVAAGRLEASFPRTNSPLSTKITSATLPSAPIQARNTPQKRRAEFPPPAADRDSDSSLSEYDGADSDAETERLHISPQKKRPGMMVQHTTKPVPLAFELSSSSDDPARAADHVSEPKPAAANSSPATPSRSQSKKRKRDESSPLQPPPAEDPDGGKPAAVLPPPKKKIHAPSVPESKKDAIDVAENNLGAKGSSSSSSATIAAANGDSSSPIATANGYGEVTRQQKSNSSDTTEGTMDTGTAPDDEDAAEDAAAAAAHQPSVPEEADEPVDSMEPPREEDEGKVLSWKKLNLFCFFFPLLFLFLISLPDTEKDIKKQKAIEDLAEIEKIFAKLKDR